MLKSDLIQTVKHSIKYCYSGKISDFSAAQTMYKPFKSANLTSIRIKV
jgi:hypothetical protein